jgi:hypothetical protein
MKKKQATELKKNVFTLNIPLWAPQIYDFVVLTSLTFPKNILLCCNPPVGEIRKAKDLSAPLHIV